MTGAGGPERDRSMDEPVEAALAEAQQKAAARLRPAQPPLPRTARDKR